MYYRIALLAAMIIVAGCASTGSPNEQTAYLADTADAAVTSADVESAPADATDDESAEKVASSATTQQEWLCRRERLTGTHYMVKICRPRYKVDEDMRLTQENMRDMQRSASNSGLVR